MSQAGTYMSGTTPINPIETLTGNSGGAVSPDVAGNIDLLGDGVIAVTTGNPGTNTITVSLENGLNGQLLIGSTAGSLAFANLASADSSVTITNGSNSIDLSVDAVASGAIITITGNTGGAKSPDVAGNFNILGGTTGLSFDGTANTETLSGTLIVANGGTGVTTLTDGGILLGSGTGAVTVTAQPTNGQLLIGSTGVDPVLATLASSNSSVTITNGAGTINLAVNAAASGAVVDFLPDSGTTPVVPDGTGSVTITGGTTGLTFVGGLNSLTQSGTLVVANGGTGATSLTDGGIVLGSGTAAVTVTAQPTNGQLLIGSTGVDPVLATLASADSSVTITNGAGTINLAVNAAASGAVVDFLPDSGTSPVVPDGTGSVTITGGTTGLTFVGGLNSLTQSGTLVVANGGTGNTTFTAYSVICAGTTATGAFQNVSGLGTAGQALTSNGAAALPTWQDVAMPTLTITSIDNTDSPYTVLAADQFIAADVATAVITVRLPNTTDTGRVIYIKDSEGNAGTNNITLTTPGGTVTIDGVTSYAMNTNYQSVSVVWTGTEYLIF